MIEGFKAVDLITMPLALLGAVLGFINTWGSVQARSVRLKVTPVSLKSAHSNEFGIWVNTTKLEFSPDMKFGVEITNLSSFAVTVASIGIEVTKKRVIHCPRPELFGTQDWPRKLEPHDSVTGYFKTVEDLPCKFGKVVTQTTSGLIFRGSGPALNQLRDYIAEKHSLPHEDPSRILRK